ncbi:MAG: hypothetical protein ABI378_04610, partial [Chitinophagaceae bacterium]
TSDLIALIPYWAVQGLIHVEEIPKSGLFNSSDMKIRKLKNLSSNAAGYEQSIFRGLFTGSIGTVLISNLRNKFYIYKNSAEEDLKRQAQKYYVPESKKVMKTMLKICVALGVIFGALFLFIWGPLASVSAVVICVFLAFMTVFLEKKNNEGNAIYSELKGFKHFIEIAEIDRIKMLLDEDPKYFEKTMSYALAFGMLEKWAKHFDALNVAEPIWYSGATNRAFGVYAFSRSFNSNLSHAQSNLVSMPSSSSSGGSSFSGGGSSGGGFGGGGGGSW